MKHDPYKYVIHTLCNSSSYVLIFIFIQTVVLLQITNASLINERYLHNHNRTVAIHRGMTRQLKIPLGKCANNMA